MRLLRNLKRMGRRFLNVSPVDERPAIVGGLRICRVEQFEDRIAMNADPAPIHVGITELDPNSASKSQPNVFQLTFAGGGVGTELTQLQINGSKAGGGPLATGDVIFETASGGVGSLTPQPFTVVSAQGFQVTGATVLNDSSLLTINLSGFTAGDTLIFSIGAAQVSSINPVTSSLQLNPIVTGADFQGTHFGSTFVATGYSSAEVSTTFLDQFDASFAAANQQGGTTLTLPNDQYSTTQNLSAYSAGAVAVVTQPPLPRDLKGVVFEDHNLDNQQETGDQGIAGVELSLWQYNGTTYVNTGKTAVTDAGGNYDFPSLLPGTYQVVKTNPPGYLSVGATAGTIDGGSDGTVTTPDVISGIVLQDGGCNCNCVNNNFAVALPASLSGYVYHDVNDDGQREPGEPGIGGVTLQIVPISVVGTPPTAPIQVVTGADGSYSVAGLNPGIWEVDEVTQPAGYLDGVDRAGTAGGLAINPGDRITNISLGDGQSGQEYDFGKLLPNSISGRVLVSNTLDCTQDPNPTPLAGVTVDLLNSTGQTIATTTTDSRGNYQFTALPPGTYSVEDVQPAGYIPGCSIVGTAGGTSVNHNLISSVTLVSDIHGLNYDFYVHPYSTLSGAVFVDPTGNGQDNTSDPPLAGVTLQLLDSGGNVLQTTQTDAQGNYSFGMLTPGTYSVRELQPNGYYFEVAFPGTVGGTAADTHDINQIALPLAVNARQYNFFVVPPDTLAGSVHIDTTASGQNDTSDPPLAGVTLQLLDSGGNVLQTTQTDANGNYSFGQMAPGNYSVRELQPGGYYFEAAFPGSVGGTASDNHDITQIPMALAVNAQQYNFFVVPPGSISGRVHNDVDGQCETNPNEPGLANVTVQLLDSSGTVLQTTLTDSNGAYSFQQLPPGTYTVHEIQPAGYLAEDSDPGSLGGTSVDDNTIGNIVLGPGANGINYNFCELNPASLTGKVMIGDTPNCAGQYTLPGVAGVTVNLLDSSGNIVATTTTDSGGNYAFTDLHIGTYTVQDVQPGGYFATTASAGDAGGQVVDLHDITGVSLGSGQAAMCYDFYVAPPASISGTVFQDGAAIPVIGSQTVDVPAVRDGILRPGDPRIAGVTLELRDGTTGQPIYGSQALPGYYNPTSPITVTTDANGDYSFAGLPAGNYSVFEVRPSGYLDGITRPGSTGGLVVGPYTATSSAVLAALTVPAPGDAILEVGVTAGGTSISNNFSVVATVPFIYIPPSVPQTPPIVAADMYPVAVTPQINNPQPLTLTPPGYYGGSSPVIGFTWHLSVIDAGARAIRARPSRWSS